MQGIRAGEIKGGEAIVIRNKGPKGSPGMPEMHKAMKMFVGMGLSGKVCLITDRRFSGSNNGCFVDNICPEAYDDGPIAYLKDVDLINLDVIAGVIDVLDMDLDDRGAEMTPYQLPRCGAACTSIAKTQSALPEVRIFPPEINTQQNNSVKCSNQGCILLGETASTQ